MTRIQDGSQYDNCTEPEIRPQKWSSHRRSRLCLLSPNIKNCNISRALIAKQRQGRDGYDEYCRREQIRQTGAATPPATKPAADTDTTDATIAGQQTISFASQPATITTPQQLAQLIAFQQQQQQTQFPQYANLQPLTAQLPYTYVQGTSPVGQTGPAALVMLAGGAAAGIGWVRRRR